MFRDYQGKWAIRNYRKTASTAFAKGGMVTTSGGTLIPATSSSPKLLGIGQKDVTASSENYADVELYPVLVPVDEDATLIGDVTGTLTQSLEGTYIDLSTALVANAAASSTDVLFVEKCISATLGVFKIAKAQPNA